MVKLSNKLIGLIATCLTQLHEAEACTAMAVSAGASARGVAMTAHSNDCIECDTRLGIVPARDYEEGAQHGVYGIGHLYPRKSDAKRSTIYQNVPEVKPLSYIPEVNHTFGLWESSYPMMNEHGLTIGESTCGSKTKQTGTDVKDPITGKYGVAQFAIQELIRIGLERCTNADCAIKEIGRVATKYGFQGESDSSGEALVFADTSGASWVMHIQQDVSTHASAIWVAQRVPDGHFCALANDYIIKEVPKESHDDFMVSKNLFSEAVAAGFWDGKSPYIFTDIWGHSIKPYYVSVRAQWIINQFAPSLNIPVTGVPYDYPFSFKAERKIDVSDVMDVYRTNYQGSDHDLTKGIFAQPFGNPHRIEGGNGLKTVKGQYARGISIPRTGYTNIGYADKKHPASWYATDEPQNSVFVPLLAETLKKANEVPLNESSNFFTHGYQVGYKGEFNTESAWWAFDIVANWMNINYEHMTKNWVGPAVQKWQKKMLNTYFSQDVSPESVKAQVDILVESWWEMYWQLLVMYNDGSYNYYPGYPESNPFQQYGYSTEFLQEIGFNQDYWHSVSVRDQCSSINEQSGDTGRVVALTAAGIGGFALGLIFSFLVLRYGSSRQSAEEQESLLH